MKRTFIISLLVASLFLNTACEDQLPILDYNQIAINQLDNSVDSAIFYANKSLEMNQGDAFDYNSYYLLGYCYTRKNDYPKALKNYLQANQVIPQNKQYAADHADILMNLGRICKIHNNYPQAEIYYNESMKFVSQEDKPGLLFNLGNLFKAKGDYISAIDAYNKGLSLALANEDMNRQVKIYNRIGLTYTDTKDFNKARSYFQTIINYEGNNSKNYLKYKAKATHNIGNTYMHAGDYEMATRYFKQAELLNFTDYEKFVTFKDLGTCYTQLNQYEKANEYYQRAEALYPLVEPVKDNIELFNLMSVSYHRQEMHKKSFASNQHYHSKIDQFIYVKEELLQKIQAHEIQRQIDQFHQEKTFMEKLYHYKNTLIVLVLISAAVGFIAFRYFRRNRQNKAMVLKIIKNSKALS